MKLRFFKPDGEPSGSIYDGNNTSIAEYVRPNNAAFIVQACNSHDDLVAACKAAIAYDNAIRNSANDPEKMASFCTAQGDDLDSLYESWISLSRAALKRAKGEA